MIVWFIIINPDKVEETKKIIMWISTLNIIIILNIMNFKYRIRYNSSFLTTIFVIYIYYILLLYFILKLYIEVVNMRIIRLYSFNICIISFL